MIVAAGRRLVEEQGDNFTTQDLIKEAGVALQTFYRHFGGKDQLLLAVITEIIADNCALFAEQASKLDDPVERLRFYVTTALDGIHTAQRPNPRFITAEHWRLHELYPHEMAEATRPFADLVERELRAAQEEGTLDPDDPERDAWLISKLVMSVYHHYSFTPDDAGADSVADDVWRFCLAAVGGRSPEPRRRGLVRLLR